MQPQRVEPGPGQESVWDYPRPPRCEPSAAHIVVRVGEIVIAETRGAHRVLETSQPPAYYLPTDDVRMNLLVPSTHRTFCEWKGLASYFDVHVDGRIIPNAVWTYPDPVPAFDAIRDHLAFYAQLMDDCTVDDERVQATEGAFYGGWITSKIVGPFKGGAGTAHW